MRMGDTPWEEMPMDQSMMSMSPMSFAQSNREFGRYVLNASLVDAGQFYRVSGDIDIAAAIEAGSEAATMMTGGMTGLMMDFSGATARVTFIIEKSTQYMHEMELIMALPMAEMGTDMSLQMNMGFSGFNDPTISVTAPDIPTIL
jgi:hypothetical protein